MRPISLIMLAAGTAVLVAAAVLVPPPGGTKLASVPTGLVFPSLKDWIAGTTRLRVTGPGGTLTLERKGAALKAGEVPVDGWALTDKGGYPVDAATIRPILDGMLALTTVEPKTARPKLYDRLDLGAPGDKGSEAKSLALADANDADIVTLIVGRRRYGMTGSDDGLYIRTPDDPRTWLARPAFDVPADALAWIDRKLVDIEADQIKRITLTPAGGKTLTLARDKPADKLAIKDVPKDFKMKSDNPGSDLAAAFRYLDLSDVRPAVDLTAAPVAQAELECFDGLVLAIKIIDQEGASWVELAASGAEAAAEITHRTAGWAYKIPPARIKTLETRLVDLQAPAAPAKGS